MLDLCQFGQKMCTKLAQRGITMEKTVVSSEAIQSAFLVVRWD